jgi:hypothetical protein
MANEYHKRSIMPAFTDQPKEGEAVGRMVLAFGEIEYLLSFMAAWNSHSTDEMLRVLYRIGATSSRLAAADAIVRAVCIERNLIEEYDVAYSAIIWCLRTRNRYAHCNWGGGFSGLFFVDLQDVAKAETGFEHKWRHVDLPLLEKQERHFLYVLEWLEYLSEEILVRAGSKESHIFPKPPMRQPPPAHNSPSKHVPHWISAELKAQHLEHALAEESGVKSPTRKSAIHDNKRQTKKERKAENDRRAQKTDPNAKGDS